MRSRDHAAHEPPDGGALTSSSVDVDDVEEHQVTAGPSAPPVSGGESPPALPSAWSGRLAVWVAWVVVFGLARVAGELSRFEFGAMAVEPAAGVGLAWLAARRHRRDVWLDGLVLLVAALLSMRLTGMDWAASLGYGAGLLLESTLAVVLLAWLSPDLWSPRGRERLRVSDLWSLVVACVVAVGAGQSIAAMGAVAGEWWSLPTLVAAAANLLGMVLVGAGLLVVHHQVVHRPAGVSLGAALRDAVGVRQAWRPWVGETAMIYAVSLVVYVVVFSVSWGASLGFAVVLIAVYIGLRHPPLFKALHATLVLSVVVLTFDPSVPVWDGVSDPATTAVLVQLLLFSVLMSGLTICVLTEERRSWEERLVRAERSTRQQMGLVSGVLDRLEDPVVVYAAGDRPHAVFANAAAAGLIGSDSDEGGLTLTGPDGRLLATEEMPAARVLAGEHIAAEAYLLRSVMVPEGRSVVISGIPWVGDWPEGRLRAIVVAHDVTDLQRQRDELEAFVGTVAHDLRNPVAVIQGWAEHLADDREVAQIGSSTVHDGLARISSVAQRMQALISGLLEWSTAQGRAVEPRPVDLRELVTDVGHSHREASSAPVRPTVVVADLPVVHGDPLLLRQVFDNLIGNAVKYVADGVVPAVAVRSCGVEDGWATIEVTDNGIGIPRELQTEVFDGFFRVSEARYAGTGLGLRICRTIVDRHGGSITVSDRPDGQGTVFSVRLPAEERTAVRAVAAYANG